MILTNQTRIMTALYSPMFSNSNNPQPSHNYFYNGNVLDYTLTHDHFSSQKQQVEIERSTAPSKDITMVKKFNHNANERDRRKKINSFISALRSLLPTQDQTKKMSMPVTISRVLRYIPGLQKQVEELTERKEELLLKVSQQENTVKKDSQRNNTSSSSYYNSDFVVSTSKLNDSEVAVHISTHEFNKTMFSEILICLENNGLFLLNASSSKTFGERVFYNLHFQVEETQRLDCDILIQKLFVNILEEVK